MRVVSTYQQHCYNDIDALFDNRASTINNGLDAIEIDKFRRQIHGLKERKLSCGSGSTGPPIGISAPSGTVALAGEEQLCELLRIFGPTWYKFRPLGQDSFVFNKSRQWIVGYF